jgi:hypothetical protein
LRPSYNVGVPFDDAADNKDDYAAQATYFGNGMALVDSSNYYCCSLLTMPHLMAKGIFFRWTFPKGSTRADIMLFNLSKGLFSLLSSITRNGCTAQDVLLGAAPIVHPGRGRVRSFQERCSENQVLIKTDTPPPG